MKRLSARAVFLNGDIDFVIQEHRHRHAVAVLAVVGDYARCFRPGVSAVGGFHDGDILIAELILVVWGLVREIDLHRAVRKFEYKGLVTPPLDIVVPCPRGIDFLDFAPLGSVVVGSDDGYGIRCFGCLFALRAEVRRIDDSVRMMRIIGTELSKLGICHSHSGRTAEGGGDEYFGRLLPCATVVGAETKITVGVAGIDKHIAAIVQLVDTGVCAGTNFLRIILPVYHYVTLARSHGRDVRLSGFPIVG